MTERVLCAVDLTHRADAVSIIREASRQARMRGGGLSVMTVIPDYGSSWVGSFFKDGTLKEAAAAASKLLHDVVDEALPNHGKVQHIVEIGNVYEAVLEEARKTDATLVAVGSHKPDFVDAVMGPNAARIVRHCPVSVLVVRL